MSEFGGGGDGVLFRGSTVFISNLKIKIRKGLVIIFDSMCMH